MPYCGVFKCKFVKQQLRKEAIQSMKAKPLMFLHGKLLDGTGLLLFYLYSMPNRVLRLDNYTLFTKIGYSALK